MFQHFLWWPFLCFQLLKLPAVFTELIPFFKASIIDVNWELVIVDCLSSLAGNAGIGCIAVVELVVLL